MAYPWLYEHLSSITSQHGEDGLLKAVFDKIGFEARWCVDIGAGDGFFISNSWNLIENNKWSGVLVECDDNRFGCLQRRYAERGDVHCLQEFIADKNSIDDVLARTPIPKRFDLLSIDIDGMDYGIWEKMNAYRPRVVVIEVNCTMDSDIDFVQQAPDERMGSSLLAMTRLANAKGYELIAHLVSNAIFVDREEFPALEIADNSVASLFFSPFVPKVVSDLYGVHYLLKEGAWGFSGMVHASELRTGESGIGTAARLEKLCRQGDGSTAILNKSGEYGFTATLEQKQDVLQMLRFFLNNNERAA